MNKNSVVLLGALCWSLLASLFASVPADTQATVTFTSPSVTIDQGTSVVDFFGQIDNSAGTSSIAPAFIQINAISGSVDIAPLTTTYGSFDTPDNLPASVAAGAVSSQIQFFSVDTTSLPFGTYSGNLTLQDSNSNDLTASANFSITVTAAPEPSACATLAVGAAGLGVLVLRARRKPTA